MPTNYTGNPLAVQAPATAPLPGTAIVLSLPVDADGNTVANFYQDLKALADYVTWSMQYGIGGGVFGDGSDGAVSISLGSITGSSGWYTVAGNIYKLTRDVYFDGLTIDSTGGIVGIYTNGFRVYSRKPIKTIAGGFITHGLATYGTTGQCPAGTVLGASAGGAGGTTTGGAGGNGAGGLSISGAGGPGGSGASGAGGSAGTMPSGPTGYQTAIRQYTPSTFGYILSVNNNAAATAPTLYTLGGGGGGAGGGGDTTNSGGAGGLGGGVVCVAAPMITLSNASDISAPGGNGGPATVGNCGGGGGGGGGTVLIACPALSAAAGTFSNATNAPGGLGGPKSGTGVVGTAGNNGNLVLMPVF